jgi:hypothetical protein
VRGTLGGGTVINSSETRFMRFAYSSCITLTSHTERYSGKVLWANTNQQADGFAVTSLTFESRLSATVAKVMLVFPYVKLTEDAPVNSPKQYGSDGLMHIQGIV